MAFRLDGKAAIVTGGASGIGAASAQALARQGAQVLVADINHDGAEAIASAIRSSGGSAVAAHVDLNVPDQIAAMIAKAVAAFGRIDILFNNAAAIGVLARDSAAAEVELDVWDEEIRVNLTAPLLASKFAIPHMTQGGGGSIIHTSSAAANFSQDKGTGYSATKSGLLGLSRSIAVQYGKQGIRSNVILPGLVMTPAAERFNDSARMEILLAHHMTPRLGLPKDIAAAVVFLASDEAVFVTGSAIAVDGGLTAYLPFVPSVRRLENDERNRS